MREIWLRSNGRAVTLGLLVPALMLLGAGVIAYFAGDSLLALWIAAGLAILAALLTAGILFLRNQPRLAYEAGELLVFIRAHKPERVPIEAVECFFGGQSPTPLGPAGSSSAKTWSIVVRLAEAQRQWHERRMPPLLGQWRDGYITLLGTWCEPIHPELVRALNAKLVAAHRARAALRDNDVENSIL